jgi:hypothetical protein
MEVEKIMRTLLTLETNSNTPRRHGSGQNNENIANTRGKLEHSTVECSSWPLLLVMFSLFCSLPCLRGVLEFTPSVSNVLIIFSTSIHGSEKNDENITNTRGQREIPRRHGSEQNNKNITNAWGHLEHFPKTLSSWSARVFP